MNKEITYEQTEEEKRAEEFEKLYEKLQKNRDFLCDEEGSLKPENVERYQKAYTKLLNEVGSLGAKVISDCTTHIYYIENDKAGQKCISDIKKEYMKFLPEIKKTIRKGTYADFMKIKDRFADKAVRIFFGYCVGEGKVKNV